MCCFFFNDTATTEISTLSLHDALPIFGYRSPRASAARAAAPRTLRVCTPTSFASRAHSAQRTTIRFWASVESRRSEEHTSELQSRQYLVCRLLLEKTKTHLPPTNLDKT